MTENLQNTDNRRIPINPKDVPFWTSWRLLMALVGFLGTINLYAQRINLSVAMVCMVNQTALQMSDADGHAQNVTSSAGSDQCAVATSGNGTNSADQDGSFVWDKEMQGFILGAFFWGYLPTQLPGGWLADRFGGKLVYAFCMLVTAISTLLVPIGTLASPYVLVFLRVIAGLGEGVVFPCTHSIWSKWAPPLERSKLVGFAYAGAQIGNVLTLPISGLLCKYGFADGWGSIFYVFGIYGIVWFILWMLIASDSPANHRFISPIEREYIETSIGTHGDAGKIQRELGIPWKAMLTSKAVWAIVIGHTASNWGVYMLLTNIPTYMKEVLKFDIKSNGFFSAIPYIAYWAGINLSGNVADFLRNGRLKTKTVRKGFQLAGKILPAIMLVTLGHISCDQPYAAIAVLSMAVGFSGCQYGGFVVNHVDIAPPFAGILFGISNTVATIPGIVAPYAVSKITADQTQEQWQMVFYVSGAIFLAGGIFFAIFAEGETQSWAKPYMGTSADVTTVEVNVNVNDNRGGQSKLNSPEGAEADAVTKL